MLPCMPVSSHSTNDSYDIRRDTRRWRLDFGSQCTWLGLLLAIAGSAQAKDCSVSRRFQVMQPQALSGVLKDPNGAVLPGIQIELLAGKKVVRQLRTSTAGTYDFEEIPSGKYRIRVQYGGGFFCAPDVECRMGGCSLKPILRLRQKPLPIE